MEGSIHLSIRPFLFRSEKNPQGVRDIPWRPVKSFTDMRKYFVDTGDIGKRFRRTLRILEYNSKFLVTLLSLLLGLLLPRSLRNVREK